MATSGSPSSECLSPPVPGTGEAMAADARRARSRTTQAASQRGPGANGFTLVELLVTLALVGILAGLTVLTLPGFVQRADLDQAARQLEALLRQAHRDALLDSVDYGLGATATGYELLGFDDAEQQWTLVQEVHLEEGIALELQAEGDWLELAADGAPPVLILSSGEMTPFVMVLESSAEDSSRTLRAHGYGTLTWEDADG